MNDLFVRAWVCVCVSVFVCMSAPLQHPPPQITHNRLQHANLILFFDEDGEAARDSQAAGITPAGADTDAAAEAPNAGVSLTDVSLSELIDRPVAEVRRKMQLWVTAGVVTMTKPAGSSGPIVYTSNERPSDPTMSAPEPVTEEEPSVEVNNLEKATEM